MCQHGIRFVWAHSPLTSRGVVWRMLLGVQLQAACPHSAYAEEEPQRIKVPAAEERVVVHLDIGALVTRVRHSQSLALVALDLLPVRHVLRVQGNA